ncbi:MULTISPECIES: DNA polymerase IV [Solibacillus]|uniref:DNA polymerase IV n=1 Tax=Solibacillus merdavium TaxID=2762218 RepID=A0ABR8XRP2_9BACL|nr:DNA polymerase IV [Solibacillus merdavium]MBD8034623.1 DNA polymerase IV [Solibacillus merdavium]
MAANIIFHLDMNSFYASVEQAHNPSLKGKPIAVAGNVKERRGIIVTSSYEARAKGIYTTMNVAEAKRLCPELLLLPPDFPKYRAASAAIFSILRSYTEIVEPVSIDEGYLDVTDLAKTRHPLQIAEEIQQRILHELDLPCSIGIAPNKFLAKTASNMKKPMGITVLRIRELKEQLWPLPVVSMHGVGEKTAKKLNSLQIFTIGDLAIANERTLYKELGKNGVRLIKRANGIDNRAVDPNSIFDTKSVGNSTTLPRDESEYYILKETFEKLSKSVAERLKVKYLAGTTVTIQIRNYDWQNSSRSKSVRNAVQNADEIFEIAWKLFTDYWDETPVRLLGVTVSNVVDQSELTQQLNLFNFEQHIKDEPIVQLVDLIETKFGKGTIKRGVRVKSKSYASKTSFSKDFLDDHMK